MTRPFIVSHPYKDSLSSRISNETTFCEGERFLVLQVFSTEHYVNPKGTPMSRMVESDAETLEAIRDFLNERGKQ